MSRTPAQGGCPADTENQHSITLSFRPKQVHVGANASFAGSGRLSLAFRPKRGDGQITPTSRLAAVPYQWTRTKPSMRCGDDSSSPNNIESQAGESEVEAAATRGAPTTKGRIMGLSNGGNIQDQTQCWLLFCDAPYIHVLNCGHTIDTKTPVQCGASCKKAFSTAIGAGGPALKCTQACQEATRASRFREAQESDTVAFKPVVGKRRRSIDTSEQECTAGDGESSSEEKNEYPTARKKRIRLEGKLILESSAKSSTRPTDSRPACGGFANPFASFSRREMLVSFESSKISMSSSRPVYKPAPFSTPGPISFRRHYSASSAPNKAVGRGNPHICEGCNQIIQEYAYRCMTCPEYDRCGDCWATESHDPDHEFKLVVSGSGWEAIVQLLRRSKLSSTRGSPAEPRKLTRRVQATYQPGSREDSRRFWRKRTGCGSRGQTQRL